jgi:hydroxyacylglutathione hydrolase
MEIYPVESGPVYTIGYLVVDEKSKKAVLIDTPLDSAHPFLEFCKEKEIELEKILLTHTHFDHMGDAQEISDKAGIEVFCHEADAYRLDDPNESSTMQLPYTIKPVPERKFLADGEIVKCGAMELEVIHTPGHSEGGICFINKAEKVVFTGDTLFMGSVGRTDLPGGDTETLLSSIKNRLMTLEDNVKVFPGHGSDTTIGVERQFNQYLLKF